MSSLHYDLFQFDGRRSHAVHAEYTQDGWTSNGIAYEDRLHSQERAPLRERRWIPAFAASNEKLRWVLLHKAWSYIHNKHTAPPDDWKTVNAAATKKALELLQVGFQQCPEHKRDESVAHVAAVKQAGSYLALLAAIAYRAWRFREDSVAIAEALHITPQAVRVNLQRLCNVARSLGYETFPRHRSFGRLRPVQRDSCKYNVKFNKARIISLYEAGRCVSEIAQAIGYPKKTGNNRVRDVLKRAGIYRAGRAARTRLVN